MGARNETGEGRQQGQDQPQSPASLLRKLASMGYWKVHRGNGVISGLARHGHPRNGAGRREPSGVCSVHAKRAWDWVERAFA